MGNKSSSTVDEPGQEAQGHEADKLAAFWLDQDRENKNKNKNNQTEVGDQRSSGQGDLAERVDSYVASALRNVPLSKPLGEAKSEGQASISEQLGGTVGGLLGLGDDSVTEKGEVDDFLRLNADTVKAAYQIPRDKGRLQTGMLVAKQKQVHLAIRSCAESAEAARKRMETKAKVLDGHVTVAQSTKVFAPELTRACDQLHVTIHMAQKLSRLIDDILSDEEEKLEPFRLRL